MGAGGSGAGGGAATTLEVGVVRTIELLVAATVLEVGRSADELVEIADVAVAAEAAAS
jgi:hypothetical protein